MDNASPAERVRVRLRFFGQHPAKLATFLAVGAGLVYGRLAGPTALPLPVDGRVRILSWNLRNFPVPTVGPTPRGADPPHDLSRLAAEFTALRPDVLGLQEVHDASALHTVLGDAYAWRVSQGGGARGQHLVIAWRTATVRVIGPADEHPGLAMDGSVRPGFSQRFARRDGGEDFTVMVVHLKARPVGAPIRRAQWDHLAAIASQLQVHDRDLVLVGDFNVTGSAAAPDPAEDFIDQSITQSITQSKPDVPAPVVERRALERRLADAGLTAVEVGPCTAYWHGVRHDDWLEPARLDLAFVAGFGPLAPMARVGTHCRRHACAPFESSTAHPEPLVASLSDHCPVVVDLTLGPRTRT